MYKLNKNKMMFVLLGLITSFSLGRFSSSHSVEVKEIEKTVYRDREQRINKEKLHTTIRKITKPDGTKIVEKVVDSSSDSSSVSERELDQSKQKQSISISRPEWSVGLYTTTQKSILGTVDKRILGPIFFGVYGRSEMPVRLPIEAGVGLRLEF